MTIPSMPSKHTSITAADVAASNHAHWTRYGADAEGAYFLGLERELGKQHPDTDLISDHLRQLQSYAHHRSRLAVRRFFSEMKGVTDEEHDLHAESIAAAKLLWDTPSSTPYIETIRKSLAVLKPFKATLSKLAIGIDPRVSDNREPVDAMIGNSFRAGRNFATKDASAEPSNAEAMKLMMSGRPLPNIDARPSVRLPRKPGMVWKDLKLFEELLEVVRFGAFNVERARAIIRDLSDRAESEGSIWVESFLEAVGNDSGEKLDNRRRLLSDSGSVLAGFTPYAREARELARGIHEFWPDSERAAKFMGFGEKLRGHNHNDLPIEALLQDAIDRGIRKRVQQARMSGESPAGVEFIGDHDHPPILGLKETKRMMGDRPSADAVLKVSRKKNPKNLKDLGPYYDPVVEELAFRVVPVMARKGFIPVIVIDDLEQGVEIRFDTKVGRSSAVASVYIDGPARSSGRSATWDDVTILSNYYEKVRVGSNGWYACRFAKDPLADTYRSDGMHPLEYLMLRNTKLPPVGEKRALGAREITSTFMVEAWTHLSGSYGAHSELRGKAAMIGRGYERLKFNGSDGREFTLLCKGDSSWNLSSEKILIASGKNVATLIDALDEMAIKPSMAAPGRVAS